MLGVKVNKRVNNLNDNVIMKRNTSDFESVNEKNRV